MRILHVLDHSLPLHSGYTFRTRAILKAQQGDGMEVLGVTGQRHLNPGPDLEVAEGLPFHRTPGRSGGPPVWRELREVAALAAAIDRVCEGWQPDVLHAHSPALCGLAALRVARRRSIPLVYEIRAFWEDAAVGNRMGREGSTKYKLTRGLENYVVGRADHVVTICAGLRDDLVARGFDPARIALSPNGVDLDLFGDPPTPDPGLGAELGLGGSAAGPVIGFIGSFYAYEGLDVLIDAMPRLLERHPGAHLLMVGGGPCEADLRAQAAASAATRAIRFTGRVPHADVARYYAWMDIMAYPRKASRLTELVTPLKPLEAMAEGKLVAASAVGGHRELMSDGENAMLFAPDDPAACADALADLADRRADWDRMREAGRSHVRERHDWSRNVRRYRDVYQRLVGGSFDRN